jgi:hypothetical protein
MILGNNNRADVQRLDVSELLSEQRQTNKHLKKMGIMPLHKGSHDLINDKITRQV